MQSGGSGWEWCSQILREMGAAGGGDGEVQTVSWGTLRVCEEVHNDTQKNKDEKKEQRHAKLARTVPGDGGHWAGLSR